MFVYFKQPAVKLSTLTVSEAQAGQAEAERVELVASIVGHLGARVGVAVASVGPLVAVGGGVLALVCCATPLLGAALGLVGLGAAFPDVAMWIDRIAPVVLVAGLAAIAASAYSDGFMRMISRSGLRSKRARHCSEHRCSS